MFCTKFVHPGTIIIFIYKAISDEYRQNSDAGISSTEELPKLCNTKSFTGNF